jgi:arginine:ornithine antiporter / lysine permease
VLEQRQNCHGQLTPDREALSSTKGLGAGVTYTSFNFTCDVFLPTPPFVHHKEDFFMKNNKLGLWLLTALVVGNMVGSGIFMLPRSLAQVASPAGVLWAWMLTGAGVLMLALVFGNLSIRKPELNGGPQMYAKALFKDGSNPSTLSGYVVSWGYWVANISGNVAILTTFVSYLSTFFPIMTSTAVLFSIGSFHVKVGNLVSFVVCSLLLWGTNFLILRGIEKTGRLNFIATTAKIIGFLIFIGFTVFAFQKSNMLPLVQPRHDDSGLAVSLMGQINNAAVTTLWAFVGIESAVVFSSRAKKQRDIKLATILGLLITLVIYMGITMLTMGTLTQGELLKADKPLVDALMKVVGPSSTYVMAIFDLIALTGTTIGWIFLSAESPFQAAKQGLFPPFFRKENKHGVPVRALVITNVLSQLFIFSTLSDSLSNAFNFVVTVATLAYLVPYLIAAIYQLKLTILGDTYAGQAKSRVLDFVIALLGSGYSIWVIKAGTSDMKTFLFGVATLVIGVIFYPFVRRSERRTNGALYSKQV